MSALFNQTNIAPGTPFATGGGGSSNPVVNSLTVTPNQTGYQVLSDTIAGGFNPNPPGWNQVGIYNSSNGQLGPLQAGYYLEAQEGGNGPSDALWRTRYSSSNITFSGVAPSPGGTPSTLTFLNVDINKPSVSFHGISTLNAGPYNANLIALMSSLQSAYPSNFF